MYGLPCVVAINRFPTDTAAELRWSRSKCRELGVNAALSEVWAKGGEGGQALADEVVRLCEEPADFQFTYDDLPLARQDRRHRHAGLPCRRRGPSPPPQRSSSKARGPGLRRPAGLHGQDAVLLSDDAKLGAPRGFRITVRNRRSAGAGFVVALTGDIMTMPGLPKVPAAEKIDVTKRQDHRPFSSSSAPDFG